MVIVLGAFTLGISSCNQKPTPDNPKEQTPINNPPADDTPEEVDANSLLSRWLNENNGASDDPFYKIIDTAQKAGFLSNKYYTCRYSYLSHTVDGQPIYLTGRMSWPQSGSPSMIVAGCHITITENTEAPSENNSVMSDVGILNLLLASKALVVFPDYEGYGNTSERAHPYLCQYITARQVADGILAARDQFLNKRGGTLQEDYKTILVGYSQGGSVAMATHKYLESGFDSEDPLADDLHFAGSVCGDGPYDPTATFKQYISDDRVYMPVVAPLILKGLCDYNSSLVGKYSINDYLTADFLGSGIVNWISSKSMNTSEIQDRLNEYSFSHADESGFIIYCKAKDKSTGADAGFQPMTASNKDKYDWDSSAGSSYAPASSIFKPDVLRYFSEGSYVASGMAMASALQENNLVHVGWEPLHPIILFHSIYDEVVPFVNYENAMSNLTGSHVHGVKFDTSVQMHVSTGQAFFLSFANGYISDIATGNVSSMPREKVVNSLW